MGLCWVPNSGKVGGDDLPGPSWGPPMLEMQSCYMPYRAPLEVGNGEGGEQRLV